MLPEESKAMTMSDLTKSMHRGGFGASVASGVGGSVSDMDGAMDGREVGPDVGPCARQGRTSSVHMIMPRPVQREPARARPSVLSSGAPSEYSTETLLTSA